MKELVLSTNGEKKDHLSLPLAAVTKRIAWIGMPGSGKTHGAGAMIEEMHRCGTQIVILDCVGIWWGLRTAADGVSPGISIPIFGGLRGDLPLEVTAGNYMADLVVEKTLSAVIDISQFESDADKARFATDFGNRFYFRKKASPSAVHLVIEEAEEILPQNPEANETRMLHAYKRIWKLGRNFGIGGSLISQRPQDIAKKALNVTELLFAFQINGSQERDAIDKWIKTKHLPTNIGDDLPSLVTGQTYAWSPSWLRINRKVQLNRKWTFDSSSTPEVSKHKKSATLAEINLTEISAGLAAVIEEQKANDPALLKAKITKLEADAKRIPDVKMAGRIGMFSYRDLEDQLLIERKKVAPAKIKEVSKLNPDDRKKLDRLLKVIETVPGDLDELTARIEGIHGEVQFFKPILKSLDDQARAPQITDEPRGIEWTLPPQVKNRFDNFSAPHGLPSVPITPSAKPTDDRMNKGRAEVMNAIAQYPRGITKRRLMIITDYRSTMIYENTRWLAEQNFIEIQGDNFIPKQAGVDALGKAFVALPQGGVAMFAHWRTRLSGDPLAIFNLAIQCHPTPITKEQIMETTGKKGTAAYEAAKYLRARMILVEAGPGKLKLADEFFQ